MRDAGVPDAAIATFAHYYEQLEAGETGMLARRRPRASSPTSRPRGPAGRGRRRGARQDRRDQAQRRARHEHGDGAGEVAARGQGRARPSSTSSPRQVLELREQHGARLPLVLMNSFSTRDDTLRRAGAAPGARVRRAARLRPEQGAEDHGRGPRPGRVAGRPELEWCPPGHGDVYTALQTSGTLEALLEQRLRVRVPLQLRQPRRGARPAGARAGSRPRGSRS